MSIFISKRWYGISLLMLLGIIWGTGYSIARFATTNGVPPFAYSFWQSLGPALVINLLLQISNKKNNSKNQINSNTIIYYFLCGLTGIALPNTIMYFAASHLPAGLLAMIVNIVPIIAYPMALTAKLESFDYQRFSGILLALIALTLIILPKASLPSSDMLPWVFITLITPISFAFCSVFVAKYKPNTCDSLASSAGMLFFSSLILFPFVWYTNSFYFFHLPLTLPDGIILLEILLSSIGYLLFFKLIEIAGPVYYSLVDTVVVITGLAWGFLIFDERLNQWTALSVCFIVIALWMVNRQQQYVIQQNFHYAEK